MGKAGEARLRCRRSRARGGASWRDRLPYWPCSLFFPQVREWNLGGNRTGVERAGANLRIEAMTDVEILHRLREAIESRKGAEPSSSYVASLFSKGQDAILKKVGEEAAEILVAAKDGDKLHIVRETADLWFHCLVMLAWHGLGPDDVLAELQR